MTNLQNSLQKRQWSKYISTNLAVHLIEKNRGSFLEQSYRNTIYCNDTLSYNADHDALTGKYCKNRWCYTCNRIRTAILIIHYLDQLKNLSNPHFVTLTLPTCSSRDLFHRIEEMEKVWKLIYHNSRKKKYRNEICVPFKGIRKAECTIRPGNRYHYHYHFILDNQKSSEWLIDQWLKRNRRAYRGAQDIRPCDERSFKEMFKYFTKLTTKGQKIDFKGLDIIFRSLRGKRTFSAFGGFKQVNEEELDMLIPIEADPDLVSTLWKWHDEDWYNVVSGEGLIGKPIPERVKRLTDRL